MSGTLLMDMLSAIALQNLTPCHSLCEIWRDPPDYSTVVLSLWPSFGAFHLSGAAAHTV